MNWPDWLQPHVDAFVQWVNSVLEYWDLDYLEYLLWLFLPILVAFLLPIFLLLFIYGCAIFVHIYGFRHQIREAYASSYWDGARLSIASFWDGVGYLWHGYECTGLENIPESGPALLVAYHGTLPLDIYYIIAKVMLYKKRTLHVVGDKFVFKIPGWGKICKVFLITPGTVEDCISNLKEGNLLIIAPGGVREALFSNPVDYQIMWGKRLGFARVILGADVPVIPVFTENCRDAFRTPRWGRRIFRPFYERTRMPICPIYGGFPVKMHTHLGKPITFLPDADPEVVKSIVQEKVRDLIVEHQRLPGSIFVGIWQRFTHNSPRKPKKVDEDQESGGSTHGNFRDDGEENGAPSTTDALTLPSFRDIDEPFSTATTARQHENEDDESDYDGIHNESQAAAQSLLHKTSNTSRSNDQHVGGRTNTRKSWPPPSSNQTTNSTADRAKSTDQ